MVAIISNPMNTKKTTPAPRKYSADTKLTERTCVGRNVGHVIIRVDVIPTEHYENNNSTPIFKETTMMLNSAEPFVPRMRIAVIKMIIKTAGKLIQPCTVDPLASAICSKGEAGELCREIDMVFT